MISLESLQTFRELTSHLQNLLWKIAEDTVLPNSFYEASIILTPKTAKDKRKLQTNIFHELKRKILKRFSKLNLVMYKKHNTP